MNEKIEFLKEQSECLKYIFEYIQILKMELSEFRKHIKNKKLYLDSKYYVLSIEIQIKKLSILIKEFNKSEFSNIKKEKLDEMLTNIIYDVNSKRRKLTEVAEQ